MSRSSASVTKRRQYCSGECTTIDFPSTLYFCSQFRDSIILSINEIGRTPPTFNDARLLAQAILSTEHKFEQGDLYYNRFKSVVSYTTLKLPFYPIDSIAKNDGLYAYDRYIQYLLFPRYDSLLCSVDGNVLQSYMEFSLASLFYYTMKEAACSEQSSRMTAMDGASKNAGACICSHISRRTSRFHRRDDRQANPVLQSYAPGSDHEGADRDHLRRGCLVITVGDFTPSTACRIRKRPIGFLRHSNRLDRFPRPQFMRVHGLGFAIIFDFRIVMRSTRTLSSSCVRATL